MQPSVHFITVATPNLDLARAFYVDGLGWEPHLDVPGEIIFFQIAPALVLGLFEADKFAVDADVPAIDLSVTGLTLAHNVDSPAEVEHLVDRLARLGATVTKSPRQSDFGGIYHALVLDPNGLRWEIAHNPNWQVTPDGTVML